MKKGKIVNNTVLLPSFLQKAFVIEGRINDIYQDFILNLNQNENDDALSVSDDILFLHKL